MEQILVQIPEKLLRALDRVAPSKSRLRSRFIRLAIQRAIMDLQDLETRDAYVRAPDDEPAWFDARTWDEWTPTAVRKGTRKRR